MNELQQILNKISELASDHADIRLATLVKAEGSTYRDVGARMLVEKNSNVYGTISGGCLEGDVVDTALRLDSKPILKEYDTTSEEDIYWGTGMGCGGKTTVLIEKLTDVSLYMKLKALLAQRTRCVALTVFQSSDPDGFTGLGLVSDGSITHSINADLAELCKEYVASVLKMCRSAIRTIDHQGKTLQVLFEYIEPIQQIVLFGDGHDVLPVMEVCKQLGWQVHIVATKEALAVP
ncbi:MAG: XdhC family protein, partial [Calditrichota bacterium]